MRRQLTSLAAAASLAVATVSSISAQVIAPVLRPPAPAIQPVLTSPLEPLAASILRELLADRGFSAAVAQGPMATRAPGTATPSDFVGVADLDVQLGRMQPEASLVWTEAGRWWVWGYGATA